MGRIDRIEVENFKSYAGHQVSFVKLCGILLLTLCFKIIGPFKHFTAVVGPNGAGMSCSSLFSGLRFTDTMFYYFMTLKIGLESHEIDCRQIQSHGCSQLCSGCPNLSSSQRSS